MPIEDVTVKEMAVDHPEIRHHVILCGSDQNVLNFVLPLREKSYATTPVIVILHTEPPEMEFWKVIYFEALSGQLYVDNPPLYCSLHI